MNKNMPLASYAALSSKGGEGGWPVICGCFVFRRNCMPFKIDAMCRNANTMNRCWV